MFCKVRQLISKIWTFKSNYRHKPTSNTIKSMDSSDKAKSVLVIYFTRGRRGIAEKREKRNKVN